MSNRDAVIRALRRSAWFAVAFAVIFGAACSESADPTGADPTRSLDGGPDAASLDASALDAALDTGPAGPLTTPPDDVPPIATPLFEVVPATPLGRTAFSVNARVQPKRQRLSWYVEYGKTTSYGSKTAAEPLGPKLAAVYRESWEKNLGGFHGGYFATSLTHVGAGGASGGYTHFEAPSGPDANHLDGIGYLELGYYFYPGTCGGEGIVNPYLGGGDPDIRDARIAMDVRGTNWSPDLSEIHMWAQSDSDLSKQNDDLEFRRANWAFTGHTLTDAVLLGGWQHVEYRLWNDTTKWSYAGNYLDRPNYAYWPLDRSLRHLNCDLIQAIVWNASAVGPAGTIDFDELTITYRNYSLLIASNGGRLVSSPKASTDASKLTDGHRNGTGKTWQSAPNPSAPQEIVYSFVRPVTIRTVEIHQDPVSPSKQVEVMASNDGATWSPVAGGVLPESHPDGPNHVMLLKSGLAATAKHVKVVVTSGYKAEAWGLGEVELFGEGAMMDTDDDWYALNTDLTALDAGTTYHYRVVLTDGAKVYAGVDQTFVTPASDTPDLATGAATRITTSGAKLDGRLTPMGLPTDCFFEWGTDATYGAATETFFAGKQITPRTVVGKLEGLSPATTYHYRVVATNSAGTTAGADRTFTTK